MEVTVSRVGGGDCKGGRSLQGGEGYLCNDSTHVPRTDGTHAARPSCIRRKVRREEVGRTGHSVRCSTCGTGLTRRQPQPLHSGLGMACYGADRKKGYERCAARPSARDSPFPSFDAKFQRLSFSHEMVQTALDFSHAVQAYSLSRGPFGVA